MPPFAMSRAMCAVLCAVSVLGFVAARAATVTTDPGLPLLDVVFCATPSADVYGDSLFVSSSSDCKTRIASPQTGCPSGAYAFNVTRESVYVDMTLPVLTVPSTYWCGTASSGTVAMLAVLGMSVVQTDPMYYFSDVDTTFTFNSATPVGSVMGLYYDSTCQTPIATYGAFTITAERTVTARFASSVANLCGRVVSSAGVEPSLSMTWRNLLINTIEYTVTPATAIRYTTISGQMTRSKVYDFALSNSSTCSDLAAPTGTKFSDDGSFSLTVTEPPGVYYFCAAQGKGVYVPASNTITVGEYGVRPGVAYVGRSTAVYPALNSTADMQVALFSSQSCSGTVVEDWTNFNSASWNVATTGTYYACVRASSTTTSDGYGYAGTFQVVAVPTVTTSKSTVVRHFDLALTLTARSEVVASATYIVGLSSSASCSSLYRNVTVASGATANFNVGADAADLLYWCVSLPIVASTTDTSAAAAASFTLVGSIPVRNFQVSYDPLRVGVTTTIALDSSAALAPGYTVALVPASQYSCADVGTAGVTSFLTATVTSSNTLSGVMFPTAGAWLLCAAVGSDATNPYVSLQSMNVYGAATVQPRGVIPRMTTTLTLTGLPPSQAVTVTDSSSCSTSMNAVAQGTADSSGSATVTLTYNTPATLLVCALYAGAKGGAATAAVMQMAASVLSANPRALPAVVDLSTVAQQLRVVGSGASALVGSQMFLTSADYSCSSSTSIPSFAIVPSPLTQSSSSSSDDVVVTTLALNDNMADTRYRACVRTRDTYADAGIVAVARASLASTAGTSNVALTASQLAVLRFPASYTSVALVDTYVVVDGSTDCTSDLYGAAIYARGSIRSATGVADMFVAPAPLSSTTKSLRVCIAPRSQLVNATYGYVDGGALSSSVFTSVSKYAQSSLSGGVTGWPVLSYASLYLVSCSGASCAASAASATCSSAAVQYPVSSAASASLKPSAGTYVLCQRVTVESRSVVVGSNTTVEVVSSYSMSSSADLSKLQPFVEFGATVSGGNSGSVTVVVQPISTPCGTSAAESQSFTFAAGVQRTLAITDVVPHEQIHFCVKPNSNTADAFEVMTGTLVNFASPTYVSFPTLARSSSVTITVPTTASSQATLARTRDCATPISGGAATSSVRNAFTFTIPPCDANSDLSEVHLCELIGGVPTYRGSLLLLRSGNCSTNDGSASIAYTSVVPGVPITDFGVDDKYLAVSGISASGDCSSLIKTGELAAGYSPSVSESGLFYVCAYPLSDPSVTFTTQAATLAVQHYEVSPRVARSSFNPIQGVSEENIMTLNHALPSGYTYFSGSATCAKSIGDAAGMNTSAASAIYSAANTCATVYVCWRKDAASAPIAVSQFQSVTPPAVYSVTPAAVRGATYGAAFEDNACGAATTTSQPSVFLSADECGSVLAGTTPSTSSSSFTTSISGSLVPGLSTASLCVATSAGAITVLSGVPVARGGVYPTAITTGTAGAVVFAPNYAGASFWLSSAVDNCSASSALKTLLPKFSTNASGYGAVSIVLSSGLPLPVGNYSLCYAMSSYLDTIEVVSAAFFDVRGTSFVAGVTSRMALLKDLQTSNLLEGFSTTPDCDALSTAYGAWTPVSPTSINVTASVAYAGHLYLCAWVAQNRTVVSVPNAWSSGGQSITFADSSLAVPDTGLDMCTMYHLDQCTPPSGSSNGGGNMLTVVYGDCCSSTDQTNAVGSGMMTGGTCSLTFNAARVQQHSADATYSLCAWNPDDISVCATLDYVVIGTKCGGVIDKKPSHSSDGVNSGAVAGIVVACVVGGLAIVAGAAFLIWYYRYRKTEKNAQLQDGDDDEGSSGPASLGSESVSWEHAYSMNIPPEGNNYGRKAQMGIHTSPEQMRRDVLSQLEGGDEEANFEDAWGECLDTNFMDGCKELTCKYKDFLSGKASVDGEDASDFPQAAILQDSQADAKERFQFVDELNTKLAAADYRPPFMGKVRHFEGLEMVDDDDPMADALNDLFAQYNLARCAIEISESTAFFNLRVLAKSHTAMLTDKEALGRSADPLGCWFSDDTPSAFAPPPTPTAQESESSVVRRPSTKVTPPQRLEKTRSQDMTALQAREWLYNHRADLEFPWVTNDFRTLVGYSGKNTAPYHHVDWSLPLLDLQAFHPLHRWWSPLLPSPHAPRRVEDDRDPRFAFMYAKSTVPFVKRYFMLFEVEYAERQQIVAQEAAGASTLLRLFGHAPSRLDVTEEFANPLSRSAYFTKDEVPSSDSPDSCSFGCDDSAGSGDGFVKEYIPFRNFDDSVTSLNNFPGVKSC